MRTRSKFFWPASVIMAFLLTLSVAGVAFADALTNDLTTGLPDATLEQFDVSPGGGAVTLDVWLQQLADSDPNCNLDSGDSANFNVASSNTGVATISPSDFNVTACSTGVTNTQSITITPVAQGTTNITFTFDSAQSTVDAGETYTANTADFTVFVDDAPTVDSSTPADGATDVAIDANITINFSEAVTFTSANWYSINCTTSGAHTAVVGGTASSPVLNPNSDFANDEDCTVQANKNFVKDSDTVDGPTTDFMNANESFTFHTTAGGDTTAPTVTISQVTGTGSTTLDTSSPFSVYTNNGTSITWSADEAGTYAVKIGANCSTGSSVSGGTNLSGTYTTGPVISSITTAGLGADGSKNVLICVTDAATNTGSASATVFKDTVNPAVSVTGYTDGDTFTKGDALPTAGCSSATDASPSSGIWSTSGPTQTSFLNANEVGTATFECSATDNAGNSYTDSSSYYVYYDWDGFYQPVDNTLWNKAKAGSAIPVKFNLGGDQGLSIFLTGYPKITPTTCPGASTPTDFIEEVVNAGGSSLTYDALANQYIYVWKTQKTLATHCYTFELGLNDGSTHTFLVQFTK